MGMSILFYLLVFLLQPAKAKKGLVFQFFSSGSISSKVVKTPDADSQSVKTPALHTNPDSTKNQNSRPLDTER